jgi:hypothetical protein
MYKSEFDDKAAEILAQHCPEALEKPMPVPIEEIARDKLHRPDVLYRWAC